jgi:O-antigen ligase
LAQWLPATQSYYVPWHIDNLYLELLIERGLLGGMVVGAFIAWALASAIWTRAPASPLRPYLAAGLFGSLVVGLVSSVLDVPRVALIFHLLPMMLIGCKNRVLKVQNDRSTMLEGWFNSQNIGPSLRVPIKGSTN